MSIKRDPDGTSFDAPAADDEALIRAVVAGEASAAEELIRRYRGLIAGLARSRFGYAPHEADDLLQSIVALLWRDDFRALRAWRGQGRFSTYLSVIVCRECRRERGQSRRRSTVETSGAFDEPPASAMTPDQQTLAREQRRALREALSELKPRDRLVLAFRFFDEREPSEFASALGLSAGAARKAVHDALGRLRRKLVSRSSEREEVTDPAPDGEGRHG